MRQELTKEQDKELIIKNAFEFLKTRDIHLNSYGNDLCNNTYNCNYSCTNNKTYKKLLNYKDK